MLAGVAALHHPSAMPASISGPAEYEENSEHRADGPWSEESIEGLFFEQESRTKGFDPNLPTVIYVLGRLSKPESYHYPKAATGLRINKLAFRWNFGAADSGLFAAQAESLIYLHYANFFALEVARFKSLYLKQNYHKPVIIYAHSLGGSWQFLDCTKWSVRTNLTELHILF